MSKIQTGKFENFMKLEDLIETFKILRGLVNYGQNLFRVSRSGLNLVSRGNKDKISLVKELSITGIICLTIEQLR